MNSCLADDNQIWFMTPRHDLNRWWLTSTIPYSITRPQCVTSDSQITKFMGPTWGPPGSCRPQMGPMLAPWTLLSGIPTVKEATYHCGQHSTSAITKHDWLAAWMSVIHQSALRTIVCATPSQGGMIHTPVLLQTHWYNICIMAPHVFNQCSFQVGQTFRNICVWNLHVRNFR